MDIVKKKLIIEVSNTGVGKKRKFHRVYCCHCNNFLVAALIEKKKYFNNDNFNITNLMDSWDDLKLITGSDLVFFPY